MDLELVTEAVARENGSLGLKSESREAAAPTAGPAPRWAGKNPSLHQGLGSAVAVCVMVTLGVYAK